MGLLLSHKALSVSVQVSASPAVVWKFLVAQEAAGGDLQLVHKLTTPAWCCDIQLAQGHGGPGKCCWLTAP